MCLSICARFPSESPFLISAFTISTTDIPALTPFCKYHAARSGALQPKYEFVHLFAVASFFSL